MDSDLTARARIRDAALRHFGEVGFERATIRMIAASAGVSPGLVRHHYGAKESLRAACDEYLVELLRRLNEQAHADPACRDRNHVAAARAALGPYHAYFTRALVDGSAAPLFDEMVRLGEEWLADADAERSDQPTTDRHARATVVTAMALAVQILRPHVSRGLGVDVLSAAGDRLLAHIMIDLYSHPLLTRQAAAEAHAGLDALEQKALQQKAPQQKTARKRKEA
ncbi:MAG TPA: TetR family transcriptional regulator [Pseudonocardiaceae bacterium]